jgi:hypothetical protein
VTAEQEVIAAMEREWPAWQVWVVQRVQGGPVWCARRRDDEGHVLNAGSAQELAEALAAAEGQQ